MGLTAFCVGAYSSRVVLPEVALAPIPDGLGFEEAAALPLAGLTAWQARLPELLWLRWKDGMLALTFAAQQLTAPACAEFRPWSWQG
jgi:hypothetical protein